MFKDLALVVDAGTQEAGTYAVSLAKFIDAHLTMIPIELSPDAYASQEVSFAKWEERENLIAKIAENFQVEGLAQGLPINILLLDERINNRIQALSGILRVFDLIILEQISNERNPARRRIVMASVFRTGRPVLVVPCIQAKTAFIETTLIAWDGSMPAARALGDALPLLSRSAKVEIVQIETRSHGECDGTMVQSHLARHGIHAELRRMPKSNDVGKTILMYAADIDADLLIMGAYGHSRMSEEMFGGTTRTIMEYMTLATFMSH
ncbi:MAG: universal stress protein [Hyphomicrobiales bacterium]|nr:universal stress protein [Hyphomicrobiales bacterium]